MRRILSTSIAALVAVCTCASTSQADYPPYTAALAPSDQFRISESPLAPQAAQAISPQQASSPQQALPPEVPWGHTARSADSPLVMAQAPAQYTSPDPSGNSTIISPAPAACDERLTESTLYVRTDYFHWNERLFGADFVNEDGELTTLGYVHRYGPQRVRGEVFGGEVNYGAPMPGNDFLSSHTDYLGLRGEYELIYDPDVFPSLSLLGGVGTRFWVRNLPDAVTNNGVPIFGYEETWWTIYPYIGAETRRTVQKDAELYGMGRIGVTAFTHELATINDVALWPRPGVTGQLEAGYRGQHLFLAAFFEGMSWAQSHQAQGWLQPASTMYTVGLKSGYSF